MEVEGGERRVEGVEGREVDENGGGGNEDFKSTDKVDYLASGWE